MPDKSVRFLLAAAAAIFLMACEDVPLTPEEAQSNLTRFVARVAPSENFTKEMASLDENASKNLADHLPPIENYSWAVEPAPADGSVEIFCSTEKSGTGNDGFLTTAVERFNERHFRLANGQSASISLRKIDSGTAYQFIASGKYLPPGFSPSNMLWVKMAEASGVSVKVIAEKLVGNVAGIVLKKSVHQDLVKTYGKADFKSLIDAVVKGKIFMGYTNPFASSTGLNFLQSVLLDFAGGDASLALGPDAVSAFEAFQKGVPFVSLTTIQMRESVEKDGTLDAFVLEYQSFHNLAQKGDYEFVPFGLRHDNPLVAVGPISPQDEETLNLFASFVLEGRNQDAARSLGFNLMDDYKAPYPAPEGSFLIQAQKLWKEKKDSGRPIVAVFLADISGSMDGLRIQRLREALRAGSEFISESNHIGLVAFDSQVSKLLPIRKFDKRHKSQFAAAVDSLEAGGNTAMFDGIVTSLQMIEESASQIPSAKPLLIVLTDGETNTGLEYDETRQTLKALKIPIYTISYGENIEVLKSVSALNEAASLNSDESQIAFQIGSLLNAEM